jgi:hypothetical protein
MKINIDVADLNDLIKRLEHVPENVEQAASRALARAGDMSVTAAKRQLAAEIGAHVRDMDEFVHGHLTVEAARLLAGGPPLTPTTYR